MKYSEKFQKEWQSSWFSMNDINEICFGKEGLERRFQAKKIIKNKQVDICTGLRFWVPL